MQEIPAYIARQLDARAETRVRLSARCEADLGLFEVEASGGTGGRGDFAEAGERTAETVTRFDGVDVRVHCRQLDRLRRLRSAFEHETVVDGLT